VGQLQVSTRKTSGTSSRIIYLVFKNVSNTIFPKSNFSIRVKEGGKVIHQADYHLIGPLAPGETQDHTVPGVLGYGLFKKQNIIVSVPGDTFTFSVGAFG
jgi:hypothetical protein